MIAHMTSLFAFEVESRLQLQSSLCFLEHPVSLFLSWFESLLRKKRKVMTKRVSSYLYSTRLLIFHPKPPASIIDSVSLAVESPWSIILSKLGDHDELQHLNCLSEQINKNVWRTWVSWREGWWSERLFQILNVTENCFPLKRQMKTRNTIR
jgi:hypothetical protein